MSLNQGDILRFAGRNPGKYPREGFFEFEHAKRCSTDARLQAIWASVVIHLRNRPVRVRLAETSLRMPQDLIENALGTLVRLFQGQA